MSDIEAFIEIATEELGYLEKKTNDKLESKKENAGTNNYTKYGKWIGLNGQPWCHSFVSWCANEAGISSSVIPKTGGTHFGANWFMDKKQFIKPSKDNPPKRGDLMYHDSGKGKGHVGIVIAYNGNGTVTTIEGNTNNAGSREGTVVTKKERKFSYIWGFGRPKYSGTSSEVETNPGKEETKKEETKKKETGKGNNGNSNSTLQRGSKGTKVEELQKNLIYLKYDPKGADGSFGTNTEKAVIAFQKANGLKPDGIVGPKTQAMLDKLVNEKKIKDAKSKGTSIVVDGATLKCTNGSKSNKLKVPKSHGAKIQNKNEATIKDNKVNVNIMTFGQCRKTNKACIPVIGNTWKNSKGNYKLNNEQVLTKNSCLACNNAGIITIEDDGQKKGSTEKKSTEAPTITFKTNRTLKYGSKGQDVVQLQKVLNKFKCGNLIPDGEFGKKTKNAVIAFQKKYGLKPDGVVGPKTRAKIAELLKKEETDQKNSNSKKDTSKEESSKKDNSKKDNSKNENNKKDENVNKYIENLRKNKLGFTKEKLESVCAAAEVLLNENYKLAFVAGILGNIVAEGKIGQFESSNYKSNPSKEPAYLVYVDKNFSYREKFSGQNISKVGIKATYKLAIKCKESGYQGKFGLGCVQWTGSRCTSLVEQYRKICGEDAYPTTEECANVESNYIAIELKSDSYKGIYKKWCNENNGGVDSNDSARSAGKIVCKEYERPKADSSKERGEKAVKIYNTMKG